MSWLELDDGILDHPKFIRAVKLAGSDAIHLWLGLRSYCGRLLTDGFVPEDMLDEVRGPKDPKKRIAALSALKSVGLLDEAVGGVRMHNYLKWSKSKAQVLKQREVARERQANFRGRNGGGNGGSNGAGNAPSNGVTNPASNAPVAGSRGEEWDGEGNGEGSDLESGTHRSGSPASLELQAKANLWIEDPNKAALAVPNPEKWPETLKLVTVVAEVFGGLRQYPRHASDPRMRALLSLWAEGRTIDELEQAIRGAGLDDHYRRNPQFQTLNTILKDSAQVDKFIRLATVAPKQQAPKANPRAVQPSQGEDPFEEAGSR